MRRSSWGVAAALAVHAAILFGVRLEGPPPRTREHTIVEVALIAPRADPAPQARAARPAPPDPAPEARGAPPLAGPARESQPVPTPEAPAPEARPAAAAPEPTPTPRGALAKRSLSRAAAQAAGATPAPPAPSARVPDGAQAGDPSAADAETQRPPAAEGGLAAARPRYRRSPEPTYPVEARRRRQEGTVLLSVRVDARGRPESIALARSSGSAALDEAALGAVERWEFEPALEDGRAVASQVEIPIRFELR